MSAPEDVLREDCGLYLSRLMFGWIVDATHHNSVPVFTETRTLDEFLADQERCMKDGCSNARTPGYALCASCAEAGGNV